MGHITDSGVLMSVRPAINDDAAGVPSAPRKSVRVATVAETLECDASEVRRMVRQGELEAHRKGKRGIRVYEDSVAAYQASRNILPQANNGRKTTALRASVTRAADAAADQALRDCGILR